MSQIVTQHSFSSISDVPLKLWKLFPVWVETESLHNEDEVAPWIEFTLNSHDPYDDRVIYTAVKVVLSNGTTFDGYIRYSSENVTTLTIFSGEKQYSYSLIQQTKKIVGDNPLSFSKLMGKSEGDIFPIIYCTKTYINGKLITGVIKD